VKFSCRHLLHLAAHAIGLVALTNLAAAQEWPTRPVTLVVPFAVGGTGDTIARILSSRMGEILGQSVIVENIGGAGGTTGSSRVAKAAPDGYQFVLGDNGTFAINQTVPMQRLTRRPCNMVPRAPAPYHISVA
jgi:tripartite-type tricarboxylate transporter receptor subunit TctC